MKKSTILIALLILTSITLRAQYNSDNLTLVLKKEIIEQLTYKNLRIYPVLANAAFRQNFGGLGNYSHLEEAITDHKIKVEEVNGSGTVNTLMAENISNDSIFLMAGEVVKGGKQDRVIASDIIIAPGEKVNIGAFCVEQGRWNAGSTGTQFSSYLNVTNTEVRKAVSVEKNQREVWDKVKKVTDENGAASGTGTYTALKNSDTYQTNLKEYLENFEGAFDDNADVIGVMVVSGDKVIGVDLFATNEMFVTAYKNLVHSYITEAITNGGEVSIKDKSVTDYMSNLLDEDDKQNELIEQNGSLFKHKSKKLHIATFH